jgi:hypothetical protein
MYQSQATVFTRYAAAQIASGRRLVATHLPDGVGCCRCCGRTWPCDEVEHGRQLIEHYRQWADDGSAGMPEIAKP